MFNSSIESSLKQIVSEIEYENRRKELREEFLTKGVRFYDKHGWGFIRGGVKHYEEKN